MENNGCRNMLVKYNTMAYEFTIEVAGGKGHGASITILKPFKVNAKLDNNKLVFDNIIVYEGCRMAALGLDEITLKKIKEMMRNGDNR